MGTNDESIIRTWILVADSAEARVFLSYPGQQGWFELKTFRHPQGRAAEDFAHQLAGYLEESLEKNQFERLILVSPPEFLGLLRAGLSKPVQDRVVDSMNKDLVSLPMDELEDRISEH
ncbi:MAG: host attachment protein [Myxococcota bacterium]|nr:host attachment protein [Myxococcota bacterium]